MFIITTPDGQQIDIDNPEVQQQNYNQMMDKLSNPYLHCPNCESLKVYGNGIDAIEYACPNCRMHTNHIIL